MSTIIEDVFQIVERDPGGKKFEKVSRFNLTSEYFEFDAQLDVNVDVYPLHEGDKVTLALAHTLALDGTKDESYSFDQSGQPSLADKYEYVMFGKLFKLREDGVKTEATISFGGLLMCLKGDPSHLEGLKLDARLYLLMRKV